MADADVTLTPQDIFDHLPEYFQADKAGNTTAKIQFDLSGDSGGQWWVSIADGKAETGQGSVENPNLTLIADAIDYVKITTGKMDPAAAYMQGKLKVKGDMGLAIRIPSLFKSPAS